MTPPPADVSEPAPEYLPPAPPPVAAPWWHPAATRWQVLLLVAIIAGGTFLRVHRYGTLPESYDASLYDLYLQATLKFGLASYPELVDNYLDTQNSVTGAILPPTRFLYVFCGYLWHGVFGTHALNSLRGVSCAASVGMLVLCAVWIWRMSGPLYSLGVTALLATAPVQVHMAEHALIDGFFAFWAMLVLWTLWECLRSPDHAGWQAAYALAGTLLVVTKENAFFVFVGVAGLLLLNWKGRFGTVTPRLLLLTVAGPLLGLVILISLAGGLGTFIHVYLLLVAKAYTLKYAILTGDGPWHRYLIDLLIVSPWTLLLAVGAVFCLRRGHRPDLYFLGFLTATYLLMCNVKYSMNLRYSTIWDLPLRYLAFGQLVLCANRLPDTRHARWILVAGVAFLCAYDLHQIKVLFYDQHPVELISGNLLRGVQIMKGIEIK